MKKLFLALVALTVMVLQVCGDNSSPLCFTAKSPGATVFLSLRTGFTATIQTSTTNNGSDWSHYSSGTVITLANPGDKIYFRAQSQHNQAFADSGTTVFSYFSISDTVEASGNIMSLYGPDCPNVKLPKCAFKGLFEHARKMTTAPLLPATELSESCYERMFFDCISLKDAPALPATTLEPKCYFNMFCGCESLINAPQLPATTMVDCCYGQMFDGCLSLTVAPQLPATTLAHYCYGNMFTNCTSLIAAPKLLATTMAEACYTSMFASCTSLTCVTDLPATSLAPYCYSAMFVHCSSLIVNENAPGRKWRIPAEATYAENWNDNMFGGTGGGFTGNPEIGVTYYVESDTTPSDVEVVMDESFVSIYPNPIKIGETIYIEVTGDVVSVELFDIEGKCVQTVEVSDRVVRFDAVNIAGLYFVRANRTNGKAIVRKYIVQ